LSSSKFCVDEIDGYAAQDVVIWRKRMSFGESESDVIDVLAST
jgi:hypothetical protein